MSTLSDDEALLQALQRGESQAFERVVRLHGDYLYRVALRVTRNEADAGDAVQEALIAALRGIGSFEGRSALRTWLHRLTVNAALQRMRSMERKGEVSMETLLTEVPEQRDEEPEWNFTESAESRVAQADVQATVAGAVDRLPEPYRIVIVLRDIEGYDTREVAEALHDTEGNVKVRLHRARAALKKLLEPLFRQGAL